ncbi:MAG: hypothetical protein QXH03_02725 [Candidatus Bathyarchaeia archaeon]
MFELLATPEELLKENYYVYFTSGRWTPENPWAEKFYVIELTQQIPFELAFILNSAQKHTLDFDDSGLIPKSTKTLYEILIGLKGQNILFYPRIPSTDYYLKLEKSGFVPDPEDVVKRFLGCYVEDDSPYRAPKLRTYTIKDMEPPVLEIYNNGPEPEKTVVRFIVNRCKLAPVDPETERKLRAKQLPYRVIKHYTQMVW